MDYLFIKKALKPHNIKKKVASAFLLHRANVLFLNDAEAEGIAISLL